MLSTITQRSDSLALRVQWVSDKDLCAVGMKGRKRMRCVYQSGFRNACGASERVWRFSSLRTRITKSSHGFGGFAIP